MSESAISTPPKGLMLVDVSNLYYCVRWRFNEKARLDYKKLIGKFGSQVQIARSIAYGAAMGGGADKFKTTLHGLGFEAKYKEPKVYSKNIRKADWDVGMAMDMVRYAKDYDVVILCTADGDLTDCVRYVQDQYGVKVWIIGAGISRDLIDKADRWEEIAECDLLSSPTSGRVRRRH